MIRTPSKSPIRPTMTVSAVIRFIVSMNVSLSENKYERLKIKVKAVAQKNIAKNRLPQYRESLRRTK